MLGRLKLRIKLFICDLLNVPDITNEDLYELQSELNDRRYACAEFAGTNTCINNDNRAALFLKHRQRAQYLQHKWIRPMPTDGE